MSGCKLSPVGLGLALGIFWGVSILLVGLAATYYVVGHDFVISMGTVFPGYTHSVQGSLIGAGIAFLDSFIFGFIIACLYNLFSCCKCNCCAKEVKKQAKAK